MALQEALQLNDEEFVVDAVRMSETLDRLTYLIHADDNTGLAGLYARQLEDRLQAVGVLLRSMNPNMREVQARLCN